ncbi:hypothetical protein [Actinophytocola sp.]|uniref:hypothetical protein n=1 Tax=Actinophytocola sp. TaxID=1872138 RepID=UPI002ED63698
MSARPAGLVLYGPPAVGKSTITTHLTSLDPRFVVCPILKTGRGRTAGYTMVSSASLAARAAAGDLVTTWRRYGARYAIARSVLTRIAGSGSVPVVQLGSVRALTAVTHVTALRWTVVQLWADRTVCADRARRRNTGDLDARMAAYDQTHQLARCQVNLHLDTGRISIPAAACVIRRAVPHPA